MTILEKYAHLLPTTVISLPHEKYFSPAIRPSTLSPYGIRSKCMILSYKSGPGEDEAPLVQFLVFSSLSIITLYLKKPVN